MEWQEADELGDSDDDSDDESMPPSSSSFKVWQRMVDTCIRYFIICSLLCTL